MLHLTQEENIILGAGSVRRLIESSNGDAALLYLCLARHGASDPEKLRAELRWEESRFTAAAEALRSMGLIASPVPEEKKSAALSPPPDEPSAPDYSRNDVITKLENDKNFSSLLQQVERRLGKLSDPSVRKLLGLYDFLGLPPDVIYLLVNFCIERKSAQFGSLPTMREIEKEGYAWARLDLFSHAAADAYLRREREKRKKYPDYMKVLGLSDRAPSPGEEKYLCAWVEMDFPTETVAIAYDKTILKVHELKWPYLNGILKRWHEKGLHTPEEVSTERTASRAQNTTPKKSSSRNAWMKDYD